MKRIVQIGLGVILFLGSGCAGTTSAAVSSAAQQDEPPAVSVQPKLVILDEEETADYSRAAEQKIQTHDAAESQLFSVGNMDISVEKEYTLMVYIVGSNLESRYGAASKDIDEMKRSGLDTDKTNLIIYTGGSKRWNSDIPNTKNSVIDLSSGEEIIISAQTESTADMGDAQTLAEFINYCTEAYPAKNYGLIFWDHGGGPLWGYGSDELFGNDSLILEELRTAMDQTAFNAENKLAFVGFDACLMGTLENANLWKNYAKYFVGSEELEAGDGWDYAFLKKINETSDPKEITKEIVNTYGTYYENNKTEFYAPDATLAAVDLNLAEKTISAVNALFEKMNADISSGNYAELNKARGSTKAFGLSAASGKESAYDLLDLKHLAENLSGMYPEETEAIISCISDMVISESTNVENTGGISIYLPGDNSELAGLADELYTEKTVLSSQYRTFVNSYKNEWLGGGKDAWDLAEITAGEDELTLQLSEEQIKNTSAAYYTVLLRNSFGSYAMTTCNVRIEPDENGVLHIPGDPMLMTAQTDMESSPVPWACIQMETNEKEDSFKTIRTYLSTGHEFTDFDTDTDELVTITVKNEKGKESTTIQDISSSAGSAWLAGKGSIDVSHYETIIDTGGLSRQPTKDDDGRILPYYEWKATGYEFYPLSIDSSFSFVMKHASEYGREFICQVCLKDVNGTIHASNYAEMPMKGADVRQTQIASEKGTFTFDLYEDHAELIQYEGKDTKIQIPDQAESLPVTEILPGCFSRNETIESVIIPDSVISIRDEAFYGMKTLSEVTFGSGLKSVGLQAFRYCENLKDIKLPESLEQIGRASFMNCGLESIEIPAGVKKIGPIPFAENENLKEIKVSDKNTAYVSKDGVLFTKDGKTLMQYPAAKGDTYAVPDGTETIGYGSFAEAPVKKITFPETLKTIENDAFYECYSIESLDLPDSLETVGDLAFGEMRLFGSVQDGETHFTSVHIGKNLNYIGTDAFTALNHETFEVNEENKQFASSGGFITNKAKDTILTSPMGMGKIVQIPEGITTLTEQIFYTLPKETEFIIPDSVFRFSSDVFPYHVENSEETGEYINVYNTVIHCNPGSAAQEYAETYGLQYDHNTDPEDIAYELKTVETDDQHILYRLYKKHAVILKYVGTGEDAIIELPAELDGVPVTGLQEPTVEEDYAMSVWERGTIMQIPSSVETIDPSFLINYQLTDIQIAEDNPSFFTDNGILFSKDKKQLVYYPSGKQEDEYALPEGTEEIEEKAFYLSNLRKVILPDSLTKIKDEAFAVSSLEEIEFGSGLKEIGENTFSLCHLKDMVLPEGLEKIGSSAFDLSPEWGEFNLPESLKYAGSYCFGVQYDETYETDVIRIGPYLKVGQETFQEMLFNAFEVSEENPYYISAEGSLMSKNGRELIAVPTNLSGEYHIPEGTETIGYSAFDHCDQITDIYFPDSVINYGGALRKDYSTDTYYYNFHCVEGSEIARQLDSKKVAWEAYKK